MATVQSAGDDLGRWWGLSRRVYLVDLCARTSEAYGSRRVGTYAAALSYYVLLSFFPLLIFIVAMISFVVPEREVQLEVTRALLRMLPAGVNLEGNVDIVVREVGHTNDGLVGFVALLGMAWSASTMFTAMRRALNSAFDVPDRRTFIRGKALDLAGVFGLILFIGVAVVLLILVLFVLSLGLLLGQMVLPEQIVRLLPLTAAVRVLAVILSYAVSFSLVLAGYRMVPDVHRPLRVLWRGAALAALGFEAAKFGFGLYVTSYGRYSEIYGALGSGVAFLAFVFVVASIILGVAVLMSVRWAEPGAADAPVATPSVQQTGAST